MGARVIQGNVFDVLPTLPRGSVDAVCTSPPYWQLRSYLPKGHALKPLELGSEPTPAAYVENMVRVLRLVRDVMADHAVAFVNVGDTYSGGGGGNYWDGKSGRYTDGNTYTENATRGCGISTGSLCLIPQRLAIALQDDGWIVRSVIVWHKPACMPASLAGWMWKRCRVKVGNSKRAAPGTHHAEARSTPLGARNGKDFDSQAQWADCPGCPMCTPHGGYVLRRGSWRPTSSWEPVLMLAKRQGYYSDGEAVKQPTVVPQLAGKPNGNLSGHKFRAHGMDKQPSGNEAINGQKYGYFTANLRDVWTIAAEPLREAHYAAFPTELVHRCLKAATSARGYCPACGAPWARVVERIGGPPSGCHRAREDFHETAYNAGAHLEGMLTGGSLSSVYAKYGMPESKTLGWRQSCACPPAEPRPGLVLDPFAGSGRVGIECLRLGLDFVGCELNPEYAAMATRLFREESPLFAGVE